MTRNIRSKTVQLMTPKEADYYVAILTRPRMHLGESVSFPRVVGFILGLRYANTCSHGFGFGSFQEFAEDKLNLIRDERNNGQWVDFIIEDTTTLSLTDACGRLCELFSEWAAKERNTLHENQNAG